MSGDHWWLILHVPEIVLVDNNLHCFKPIPTHCNSFAGNVSRMLLNIHSAWAQDLGQLAEAWWMTSIWRSNRKVVIKQCISFLWQPLQKTMDIQNGLLDGTKPLPSMLTVRSNDIHLRSISQEILQPATTNISFKIAHLNIHFNLTGPMS